MGMLGRVLWLVFLPGWACDRPQCTDYTDFQAQRIGVNITGFQDQGCLVTFSRGGNTAAYFVAAPNGGLGDAALPPPSDAMPPVTPDADAFDPACAESTEPVACPGTVGLPPATCMRSASCLKVDVFGQDGDELVGRLGGPDYHVTVTCGGVVLYQADDDAHRERCRA